MKDFSSQDIELKAINTIRTLSMDAVQQADSGHPGTPMALAPVTYEIWQSFLRFDPQDPIWPNRDRFVLSVGHASMLLYSMLYLTQTRAINPEYENLGELAVSMEDIKCFRQLDSKAAGHPEYRWTSGVETTTGPLGQGVATSVGMALASRWMAAHFNRPGYKMFDYDVFTLCSDGDIMEGVSAEAASFAGHNGLDNLVWIYDNNRITIEGHTDLAFTEDVATRFLGHGWNVLRVGDANDTQRLKRALNTAKETQGRPTLIIVDSHIAFGSPNKQDTSGAHGSPLGEEEIKLTKRAYGWPEDKKFFVPDEVLEHFKQGIGARGRAMREAWFALYDNYKKEYPELADQLYRMQKRSLPEEWDADIPAFDPADGPVATRKSNGKVLNAVAGKVPWLMGGSADLAPSTKTLLEGESSFSRANPGGRNLHFGVREHAMAAISNGLSLSKIRPYAGTFLIFSDYARPSIRLCALMELPVIYIFTHDSIGLGEDGPTHQPVEHLAALRAIPGLTVMRPADANEVAEAWRVIMKLRHTPAALVLSRQSLPTIDRKKYASAKGVSQGAYVLADAENGEPDVILLATGSEVHLCLEAREKLLEDEINARVVSMPSWDLFDSQDQEYRDSVLPPGISARVAVEQASNLGWYRWVGSEGEIIGMNTFGTSAPLKKVQEKYGFLPERIVDAAREQINRNGNR